MSYKYIFVLLLGVFFYWFIIFGISSILGLPEYQLLVHLGVPALQNQCSDMSLVATWCDWAANGRNPFIEPPIDAEGRTLRMNYPPIFLSLHWLGFSANNFMLHAVFWCVAFYFSLAFFARPACVYDLLVWIGIACSPAIVFAVERANFDLVVFVLLAIATFLQGHRLTAVVLILLASLIKFYPLAGMGAILGYGRRWWLPFFGCIALFCAYLYLIRGFLPYIFGSLDGNVSCAFGSAVIPAVIGRPDLQIIFQLSFLGIGFLFGIIGIYFGKQCNGIEASASFSARLGLPIFLILFLSGAQFDYKMVFLVFVVPAILSFIKNQSALLKGIGKIWFSCYFIYIYWMFFSGEACLRNFLIKQGVASLLFLLSCFICGVLYRKLLVDCIYSFKKFYNRNLSY